MLPTARDFEAPKIASFGVSVSQWPTGKRQAEPLAQDPAIAPYWNSPQVGGQVDLWFAPHDDFHIGAISASSLGGGVALLGIAARPVPGMVLDLLGGGQVYVRPATDPASYLSTRNDIGPVFVIELNRIVSGNSVVGIGALTGFAPWGEYSSGECTELCFTPSYTGVYSTRAFMAYVLWKWQALDMKLGIAPAARQPLMMATGLKF